jgi:hypothetical protein
VIVKHQFATGALVAAIYVTLIIVFVFQLPFTQARPENLLAAYTGLVQFNGVLLGFAGIIAVFAVEKLHSMKRREVSTIATLTVFASFLIISTLLMFRCIVLLPTVEIAIGLTHEKV